jgi:hypothetical protein
MSFRQCPRRVWLEVHRPELASETDAATRARFEAGHAIGEIARRLYDPGEQGILIDNADGLSSAMRATAEALVNPTDNPLFEATFERDGLLVRTDILERRTGQPRVIEVKSSTRCKPEHVTDCAIQAWVLEASSVPLVAVTLAHLDSAFVYAGEDRYDGLLREQDLTAQVAPLREAVPGWLEDAQRTLADGEPAAQIGSRCFAPYDCPFRSHCWPQTQYPLTSLPGGKRHLDAWLGAGYRDVRELPETLVRGVQAQRAWHATRSGEPDRNDQHRAELRAFPYPRYFLDFETIGPALPRWPGMRPYQLVPFQWSLHIETAPGRIEHTEHLDLSGEHPARSVSEALLRAVGLAGPIFMYTGYERLCLETLARFCPDLSAELDALGARLVDLHPLLKQSWYHPAMLGSWSLKSVLPTIAPDMDYSRLDGVQDGTAAQLAWFEAVAPGTTAERRRELREQLLRYCAHDTLALVRIAHFLEGR